MPLARRDERSTDALPDPRLSPLTNPHLGKNLGRWADVYYTTPPEQREQAVLALVRELEGEPLPARSQTAQSHHAEQVSSRSTNDIGFKAPTRFCMMCGSPAQEGKGELSSSCLPVSAEALPSRHVSTEAVVDSVETESWALEALTEELQSGERQQSWKHLLVVLTIAIAVGAWGVRWIQLTSARPLLGMASPPPTKMDSPVQVQKVSKASNAHITNTAPMPAPPKLSAAKPPKPTAGKPIECRNDSLQRCSPPELRQKAWMLASAIDGLYLQHDRRTRQLIRRAMTPSGTSSAPGTRRLRQANYATHISEHAQLQSYARHERRDALRYRAELVRRGIVPASEKTTPGLYSEPQSCLDLHYIAEDLRRLALRLPRAKASRDSTTPRMARVTSSR